MIPLPKKCSQCQCRRCYLLGTCDIGDEARRSPCQECGDEPYITEGCRFGGEEPVLVKPQSVVDAFNRICTSLPRVEKITPKRRDHIRARGATLEEFERVFQRVEASEFLSGRGGWRGCSFDWIIRPNNWQKIAEGNYAQEHEKKQQKINPAVDYPQNRYTEEDLRKSGIYVNLDGDDDDEII